MIITIVGLLITTLTAIYSTISGDSNKLRKTILSILATIGFIVGFIAAFNANARAKENEEDQRNQRKLLETKLTATEEQLLIANRALKDQGLLIDYVSNAVGQLSKLNDLGGTKGYYIRIAFGKTRAELTNYESALIARFPNGKETKLIQVRPIEKPKGFELIFGSQLTLASAEVFQRLATGQGFANGRPEIRTER